MAIGPNDFLQDIIGLGRYLRSAHFRGELLQRNIFHTRVDARNSRLSSPDVPPNLLRQR